MANENIMKVAVAVFILFVFILSGTICETLYCTGKYNNVPYCQYQAGDVGTNIVINSPHGGDLKPPSIPNRQSGCYDGAVCSWTHNNCTQNSTRNDTKCRAVIFKDMYTKELSILLADQLKHLTGKRPYLIINDLHRIKMDGNRDIDQACFKVVETETAYNEYHAFIQKARNALTGRGLFIDMHGQTHKQGWIELGYTISKSDLNNNQTAGINSSLRYLSTQVNVSFDEILRGKTSLGQLLQKEGYKTVPSLHYYSPGSGSYYSGGYNTKTYGSRYGGKIDGVQIETHKKYRNATEGPAYIKALARSISTFMKKYYVEKDDNDNNSTSNKLTSWWGCLLFSMIFFISTM